MKPFALALQKAIRAKIKALLADGTVGMSPDNLLQVVRTPDQNLEGAPRGTNAPYYYKQTFREVLATVRVRGFEVLT